MQLRAEGINFRYNCGGLILDNVNFSVESGELVGLLAPSGFGKTTLTKLLAGYLKPESGKIEIVESNATDKTQGQTSIANRIQAKWKIKQNHGFNPVQLIFQHPEKAVNPRWRMGKIMREAGEPSEELISAMGIKKEWLNRWPTELSGGELQRFCVLRALNEGTRFLIADEMTAMLDAITQVQIWRVVTEYAKAHNIGVIVISHERALINRICDRVVEL